MIPAADTIAAIATPAGQGGIGIIRISGPRASHIVRALCPSFPQPPNTTSHKLYLVKALTDDGEVLDQLLAVLMLAPRSYTTEDVVELHAHGGPHNMRRLLEAVCRAGARPAEPGEFTRRAFINGRLDLTQAEAVTDVIHATGTASLRLAQDHLDGQLGREITSIQEELATSLTLTEAAIDFSQEEHIYKLDRASLQARLDAIRERLSKLLLTYEAGRQVREGPLVVLIGRPNAGKSTLFNAICGTERAIVTPTPGTTRDYLEETVHLGDRVSLRLADTAGLHETSDPVEQIGVGRAIALAQRADVIVWLIDGSADRRVGEDDLRQVGQLTGDIIPVLNKTDLPSRLSADDQQTIEMRAGRPALSTCAAEGLSETLREALKKVVQRRMEPATEGVAICRERHRCALLEAFEALERAQQATRNETGEELIAADVREALERVGDVTGTQITSVDVLERLFAEFCVGK